jgi:hypothetical protein
MIVEWYSLSKVALPRSIILITEEFSTLFDRTSWGSERAHGGKQEGEEEEEEVEKEEVEEVVVEEEEEEEEDEDEENRKKQRKKDHRSAYRRLVPHVRVPGALPGVVHEENVLRLQVCVDELQPLVQVCASERGEEIRFSRNRNKT